MNLYKLPANARLLNRNEGIGRAAAWKVVYWIACASRDMALVHDPERGPYPVMNVDLHQPSRMMRRVRNAAGIVD